MNRQQRQVRAFHRKMSFGIADRPSHLSQAGIRFRAAVLSEEANELIEALDENDLAHIAGECCDVIYVTLGVAVQCGIDLEPFWREIHAANMRKIPSVMPGHKAVKPENWQPAPLQQILNRQRRGFNWPPWAITLLILIFATIVAFAS